MDAARYGLQTTIVEDCLGYRQHDRHELALDQLHSITRARALPASQIVEILRDPSAADNTWSDEDDEDEGYEDDEGPYDDDSEDDSDEDDTPNITKAHSKLGNMTAADLEVDSEDSDDEECNPKVCLSRIAQEQKTRRATTEMKMNADLLKLNMEMLMSRNRLVMQTSQLKISSPKMRKRQLEPHEQTGKHSKIHMTRSPPRTTISPHSEAF
jgi:hypothetical protein